MSSESERLLLFDNRTREEWLIEHQPAVVADRPNWWRSMLWLPKRNATYPSSMSDSEVLEWANLAVAIVELMLSHQVIDDQECASEIAWLSVGVAKRTGGTGMPTGLSPDVVASRCLAATGFSLENALRLTGQWEERSIEDVRALRRVKNLISPLPFVADRIEVRELKGRVELWVELLDRLP